MDALSLEQQLPSYSFFTQTSSQQQQQAPVASSLPQTPPLLQSSGLQRGPQLPPLSVTVPSTIPQSPPGSQSQPSMGIDINSVSLGRAFLGEKLGMCSAGWEMSLDNPVVTRILGRLR